MSLSNNIRTLRALGRSFGNEAADSEVEAHALLLSRMSAGFTKAAIDLEQANVAAAEAFAAAHRCTVDHVKMTQATCPCCGVRRGK